MTLTWCVRSISFTTMSSLKTIIAGTLVLLAASPLMAQTASEKNKKPNILFIITDDHAYQTLGTSKQDSPVALPNFNKLAKQSYPTLALVQGHCLGGGLELALACRYCLAVDQDDTRLALPEVMLGIFPGWGGMLRLPEYIGPAAAMDLMLSGKSVDARKAARLGMEKYRVALRELAK